MTIQDLIAALGRYSILILIGFALVPLAAYGYGKAVAKKEGGRSPHKYVYAVLVYVTSIPGIFASILTAYALFMLHSNLLQVNVAVHFVPIISMIATMIIIRKNVSLDDVPGFDRLYGLLPRHRRRLHHRPHHYQDPHFPFLRELVLDPGHHLHRPPRPPPVRLQIAHLRPAPGQPPGPPPGQAPSVIT